MAVEPVAMRPDRPVPAWQLRAWELIAPRLPLRARRLLGRLVSRLPLGSRARRWCVLGFSLITWDALGRGRYDLVLPIWDPTVEWRWDARFVALGWDELYRGHEGVERSVELWNRTWNVVSFTVREVLDGGDTLLQRVTLSGRGIRSDVPTQMEVSVVARLDPLIVDFYNFLDDADAVREAGFAPIAQDAMRDRP